MRISQIRSTVITIVFLFIYLSELTFFYVNCNVIVKSHFLVYDKYVRKGIYYFFDTLVSQRDLNKAKLDQISIKSLLLTLVVLYCRLVCFFRLHLATAFNHNNQIQWVDWSNDCCPSFTGFREIWLISHCQWGLPTYQTMPNWRWWRVRGSRL